MMGDLKIYQIKAGKVFFRDFWMLSQNRLADLPNTLELDIPAKLYFPHKYNKNSNFGIRLPHLPPFEDYCPGGMKEKDYEKFAAWYEENYETEFELEGGFEKADNQSKIAVKYLEWLAYRDGVKVRHACNGGLRVARVH
uniref:DNA-directed DNA polymerase n=1 Tax=Globodera pallida TaxID=36090 RepID=A0A183CIC8_GLOPA